ncbi:hypothetical protein ABEB36_005599 [Hypothenemus hampei]|uniref:RNA polymerase I-specific transcription initiation factor RRN3 n=1 Tax=Hypothenemus hampei TaxID=57062 RepID=A0ABD1F004_HYPHA
MSLKSSRISKSTGAPSILKKTTHFKRRLTEIAITPSKVRFQLPHSKKVKNILEAYKNNRETRDYFSLLCVLRDSELFDSDITSLLNETTECISLLNRDFRLFVEALLSIKWINRDPTVVKEYQSFIVNLLSAHNYHAKHVISYLVELFLPDPNDPEWPDGKITENDKQKCLNVHVLIQVLLNVIPMCKDLLLQSLYRQYPYYNKPVHTQEYYLHNLLTILSYQPSFMVEIFQLIFSKLVIMDINAPKEVLEEKYEENMFQVDEDVKSVKTVSTNVTVVNRSSLGIALDTCMDLVLNFILQECKNNKGEVDLERVTSIYNQILTAFDKVILPTYGSHHIQFIMFYLCSINSTVTESFLTYLWKKVCNPNVAIVLRRTSVTYIVSLVARGLFVPLSLVKATMQRLSEWVHTYMTNLDGLECVNSDLRIHTVFYSVCQALFYLVAFRHKDLINKKKDIIFLESLQLGKMVSSRLNPLRVCQPTVVHNFATITRKYQLAYCYTVIDHNSRNTIPTIYQNEKGSQFISDIILNDVYPFDPYILERSGEKIQRHYRNYQEEVISSHMEIDSKDNDNIDDFLDNIHEI